MSPRQKSKHVAIIGAGASGLVCAKECVREGHRVRVFEQSKVSGGTWVVEPVPAELQTMNVLHKDFKDLSNRICSSMYEDLRTNLPRELMGFLDFPFDENFGDARDLRPHPCHQEVRRYLDAFKSHYRLERWIEYESVVVRVEHFDRSRYPWDVDVRSNGTLQTRRFDAVIVASGHLTVPNVPKIDGMHLFKRLCLHSHLYRNPSPFRGQTVVVLGNSYSGQDLAEQIGTVASAVYFCGREWPPGTNLAEPVGRRGNIHRCETIEACIGEGQFRLRGGRIVEDIDVLIFCTGYLYDYPFLKGSCSISTTDRIVYPLYKQLLHSRMPTLAFPLVPTNIIPFILAEYQAKYLARVFSERVQLPERSVRMESIDSQLTELKKKNIPLERWILIGADQFEYMNDLADSCDDVDRVPTWWDEIRDISRQTRSNYPNSYRDVRIDGPCFDEARKYYASLRRNRRTDSESLADGSND